MKIDQIIRSSRKTIAIIVQKDGKLIVRAPYRASEQQIMGFVRSKADWILEKQEEVRHRQEQMPVRRFVPGEKFPYLGSLFPLESAARIPGTQKKVAFSFQDGRFWITQLALSQAKELFEIWYKRQARFVFETRVSQYAQRFGLTYTTVKISSARTRWGSCSSKGTLSFTWRLVMAPIPVIDYVIIHELAHLIERNHSDRFWKNVERMYPDYKIQEKWLKQYGNTLSIE